MAERLDPLAEFFVSFEERLNSNTHQIVVLTGHLDLPRLRRAITKTVSEFELATTGLNESGTAEVPGAWKPEDVPFLHYPFSGKVSFEESALRRVLMRLSQWHPVRWKRQPPVQFFYLTDDTGERSALMFNSQHGIADARSDTLLLERLMTNYGMLSGDSSVTAPEIEPAYHPHTPYRQVRDRCRVGGSFLGDAVSVTRELAKDLFVPCKGYGHRTSWSSREEVDFHHERIDAPTEAAILDLASRSGHTVNTVLMGALYRAAHATHGGASHRIKILCPVSLRNIVGEEYRDNFQNFMVPCSLIFKANYPDTAALFADISETIGKIKRDYIYTYANRLYPIARMFSLSFMGPIKSTVFNILQGSNIVYSNPGVIHENLDYFGTKEHAVLQYVGLGCLVSPYDFIFYTPKFRDHLYFNAIYRSSVFPDVQRDLIDPIKNAAIAMAEEYKSGAAKG